MAQVQSKRGQQYFLVFFLLAIFSLSHLPIYNCDNWNLLLIIYLWKLLKSWNLVKCMLRIWDKQHLTCYFFVVYCSQISDQNKCMNSAEVRTLQRNKTEDV